MSTLETSTKGHAVPSFNIFKRPWDKSDNTKIETLIHCHMAQLRVSRKNLPAMICARDGKVYTAVYDSRMPEGKEEIEIIISFQQHTYGRFAVIRVAAENNRKQGI